MVIIAEVGLLRVIKTESIYNLLVLFLTSLVTTSSKDIVMLNSNGLSVPPCLHLHLKIYTILYMSWHNFLSFCVNSGLLALVSYILSVPVSNVDFFFLKKQVKFRKNDKKCFIQSILHRLLYIFPIFRAIRRPFSANYSSSHFFTSSYEPKRCSASAWNHQCKQVVIGRSQVWWITRMG